MKLLKYLYVVGVMLFALFACVAVILFVGQLSCLDMREGDVICNGAMISLISVFWVAPVVAAASGKIYWDRHETKERAK